MKNLIASRLRQDSESNQHGSTNRAHGNSENVLAAKHEVRQDVGEEDPLKLEPVSELKSITPGRAAVTGEILAERPVTPLEKVVNASQRGRKVGDSIPDKLPVGGNHSAITDSGKGTGGSSKRRRKAWSGLKEITEKSDRA
ncbi:hypothetical protein COCNU_09G007760 [Cocos nucifera]|uniref:Uncharacterized protein n=1 Tax=Cocos nucifera TaxID=13894 RepID=A0A8K0IKG0_COCNU|nr:hypothetical protein COCNU_09G007760 [Cocos nucifera]